MTEWWEALDFTLQIFYGLGIATGLLLLFQTVLLILGLDGHGAMDMDVDGNFEHDMGGVLSVRTVTAFFAGFSWTGVATIQAGWSMPLAILASVVVGTTFMAGVFFLMRGLYGLRASGTLDYANAVGAVGTVYLPIPPAMASTGQVEVMIQGRLCVVQAFTRSEQALANRTRVRVTEALGANTLVVEPLTPPPQPTDNSGSTSS